MKARKILIAGGLALLLWGMGYGFWYAVFAEHQALEGMGASLATGFAAAAQKDAAGLQAAMDRYTATKYVYDRQVDIHGHWIGLAMVLLILGLAIGRAEYSEKVKTMLAWALLAGAVAFPAGVWWQMADHGAAPRLLAAAAAGVVIAAMGAVAAGMLKQQAQ